MSQVAEFPLPSLRQFLMPNQTVQLRVFMASSIEELEQQVNEWIQRTKAIVAVPGPVTSLGENSVSLALTYVPAVEV